MKTLAISVLMLETKLCSPHHQPQQLQNVFNETDEDAVVERVRSVLTSVLS